LLQKARIVLWHSQVWALVAVDVMNRRPSPENARIHHYRLTQKGLDLLPVLAALMHWGDRWIHDEIGPPIVLVDRQTQAPIRTMVISSADGASLRPADLDIQPGPGATPAMRERLLGKATTK
jgi:hypothetical protein